MKIFLIFEMGEFKCHLTAIMIYSAFVTCKTFASEKLKQHVKNRQIDCQCSSKAFLEYKQHCYKLLNNDIVVCYNYKQQYKHCCILNALFPSNTTFSMLLPNISKGYTDHIKIVSSMKWIDTWN